MYRIDSMSLANWNKTHLWRQTIQTESVTSLFVDLFELIEIDRKNLPFQIATILLAYWFIAWYYF